MGRANLAIALALIASAVSPAAASAGKFHYTHRVSISGSLVDRWTINDTRSCGPVGDGTVTVAFHQTRPAKALVEYNRVEGRWLALVPGKIGLVGLGKKPVVGTIGFADNTVATAPPPGSDCSGDPIDKSHCGTSSFRGNVDLGEGKRRGFETDMGNRAGFQPPKGGCGHGQLDSWTQPPGIVGGLDQGLMLVKMPSPRSFKRRHTVTVTATTHKSTSFGGFDPDTPKITDDVTRSLTVTFTRL